MNAVEVTSRIISWLGKGLTVAGAVYNIKTHLRGPVLQKLDALAQGVFLSLYITDFVMNDLHAANISTEASIGIKSGEAAGDVLRFGTAKIAEKTTWKKEDVVNLLSYLSIAGGDVTNFICHHHAEILPGQHESLELVASFVTASGTAIKNRRVLFTASKTLVFAAGRLYQYSRGKRKMVGEDATKAVTSLPAEITALIPKFSGLEAKERESFVKLIIAFREKPLACDSIPDFFDIDLEDWHYVCAISSRPIRHIVVPNTPSLRTVFYERATLEAWIKENPDKIPPCWPKKLSVSEYSSNPYLQDFIDEKLQRLAKKLEGIEI